MRALAIFLVLNLAPFAFLSAGPDPVADQLDSRFRETVRPFIQTYCAECHGLEKPKADLNLLAFSTLEAVVRDQGHWQAILEQLQTGAMPPERAKQRPTAERRQEVVTWIKDLRNFESKRNAGDPGHVLARRLSNAEYDYTIRDLTGADIRPTQEFPVDPANEAGFDNSGESLAMSPALLKKYLEAARRVADHVVLKPEGFAFAPFPVISDTDRDKYAVRRIIDFYQRQRTDYADYFQAAWRFRHRAALARPNATLADVAAEAKISPKYLETVWTTLTETPEEMGPIAALQGLWKELPPPVDGQSDAFRAGCERMRTFVVRIRQKLVPDVKNLTAPRMHNGAQPLVLWKDREFAANRRRYAGGALKLQSTGLPADTPAGAAMTIPTDATAIERYEASFTRFCSIFPDAFVVSERARVYLDPEKEKALAGRLLNAGFHSQMGYFRDDGPLYELMLDPAQQRELDGLWKELDFITAAPMRQYAGFLWFERTDSSFMRDAEFDFARAEDKDATSEAKLARLADAYLAKARRSGANAVAQEAIRHFYDNIAASVRWVEHARQAAEPSHLSALLKFAERAYRRPLTQAQRDDLFAFYKNLREKNELNHEEAIRDAVVAVLMSPHFCYRVDLPSTSEGIRPLSDYALASRLSYFLWSSMPDAELLAHASAGDLHRPEIIAAQARRMVRDDRVRGLAVEFGGNWLDVRRFEEHNSVDRERFKSFTNELRQAMFEEPVRFLMDTARADRSVLDLLYANHTFVNPVLARHYGMTIPSVGPNEWVCVDGAHEYGRGGLLPMAVFLTKNAPGLRTSPVKRGYWVVRRLLGEHIPPPPAEVPELPADEAKLGDLTLRETLARHRSDKNCAACHERFDAIGLVFEGYGPIGERRNTDLGGRPVDTRATFPGGSEGTGLDGLRSYLRAHRQDDFLDNLCRKLLVYALGRGLMLSDDETIHAMRTKLAANDYRFGTLIDTIVTSPQFLTKRGTGDSTKESR